MPKINTSYFYENMPSNDNGVMVPVFIGFDLVGWKIT